MKVLKLAVICCLISMFATFPFEAKSYKGSKNCISGSLKSAYESSKAVFVGEVLHVTEDKGVKTITFRIEESWKGADSEEIKVNAQETIRYQALFEVREKYLVFAQSESVQKDRKLWIRRCSRTTRLADASKDIEELGQIKKSAKTVKNLSQSGEL